VLVTAGVGCAHEVFVVLFVEFQIIGDFFADRMVTKVTKNDLTRWVFKPKVFHEFPP
jgi:hypothetical protein